VFSFQATGNPPQKYRLVFTGAGFKRDRNGVISVAPHHEVLVELGAAYPRMIPNLAWQTPIFHPNISNNGVVCLGGYGTHWVPSLTLSEMCTMLWDMIRYKNFDSESPYNREAALWAKTQSHYQFPIDGRSIRDRISSDQPESAQTSQSLPEVEVTRVPDEAPVLAVEAELVEERIEIIETVESGIEIIDTNFQDYSNSRPDQASDDGIVFLD